jgi:hypothetical protein
MAKITAGTMACARSGRNAKRCLKSLVPGWSLLSEVVHMDPISTAIIAAIAAGATTAATDVAKSAIVDSYGALKSLIQKKLGPNSEVVDAIEKLQTKPDSAGRRETLKEEIKASNAGEEPELLAAAKVLVEIIKASPNGEQHLQQARGIGIAQASGGSSASVTIYRGHGGRDDN